MSFPPETYRGDINNDTLQKALYGRFEAMRMTGEKLVEEHRMKCAEALLSAGLCLIPSEHLEDNQFVVSRGVYEAVKKLVKDGAC